jgi:Rha family phage regulatory protein
MSNELTRQLVLTDNLQLNVSIKDNKIYTTSREIAKVFGKHHKSILTKIKADPSFEELVAGQNFVLGSYLDENNQKRPEFILDRLGIDNLIMSFTGKEASIYKRKLLQTLYEAEKKLQEIEEKAHLEQINFLKQQCELEVIEAKKLYSTSNGETSLTRKN